MNERLKKLRKKLDLTQEQFAARLGIKRGAIANYEIGRNEPVDSVVSLICREFHVNETWLREGRGEMFMEDDGDFFSALALEYNLNKDSIAAVRTFTELSPESRQVILDYVKALSDAISNCPASEIASDSVEQAEELYKKSLFFAQNTESSASPITAATGTESE